MSLFFGLAVLPFSLGDTLDLIVLWVFLPDNPAGSVLSFSPDSPFTPDGPTVFLFAITPGTPLFPVVPILLALTMPLPFYCHLFVPVLL